MSVKINVVFLFFLFVRYIVEVADFDFSNASDMEYKTFRERLIEAVSNAFNKTEDYSEQDSTNGVPASKKYGSMQ